MLEPSGSHADRVSAVMNGAQFSTDRPDPGAGRRGMILASLLCAAVFVVFFALGRAVSPAGVPREATGPSIVAVSSPTAIPTRLSDAPAIEVAASAPPSAPPQPRGGRSSLESPSARRPLTLAQTPAPGVAGAPAARVTPTSSQEHLVASVAPSTAAPPAANPAPSPHPVGHSHTSTSVTYESSG